jgi:dimethylamine/trimethylamine dehydrogenase
MFAGSALRADAATAGVRSTLSTHLHGAEPGRIQVGTNTEVTGSIEADALVVVTHRVARDELFHELAAPGATPDDVKVFRVGDCVTPRLLEDAIFDGRRLGMEIEDANPSEPRLHVVI